jgi:hypothetical protein
MRAVFYSVENDIDRVLASLNEAMIEDGKYNNIRDFFVFRTRCNLRICLCIDETNSKHFLAHLKLYYPSSIKYCSSIVMGEWSDECLQAACSDLFQAYPSPHQDGLLGGDSIEVKTKTRDYIELIKAMHESAMPLGSTPRHLVKLIKMWDVI